MWYYLLPIWPSNEKRHPLRSSRQNKRTYIYVKKLNGEEKSIVDPATWIWKKGGGILSPLKNLKALILYYSINLSQKIRKQLKEKTLKIQQSTSADNLPFEQLEEFIYNDDEDEDDDDDDDDEWIT